MPLSNLNHEQYKAATTDFGYNLIIASAGTGKTSTIIARISYLLNKGSKPEDILLLTFTNKAGEEMLNRLKLKFDSKIVSKIMVGTFHSVSNTLLKKYDKKLILKQPSDLKTLLKSIIEKRRFDHLSDVTPYGGAYLYDIYSLFVNTCVNDEDFADWFSVKYGDQAIYAEIYEDILKEFEEEKERFDYADFNDLLLQCKRLLKEHDEIKFDEILVDEYQDTNSLQGSLIESFNTKSLFCVGDFDQSIYAFNGANIEIIGGFKDRYKNANIHTLNINYRSSEKILKLANKVISNNPRLYEKNLQVSRSGEFKAPTLLVFEDIFAEYTNIAERISMMVSDRKEIAIIFRNNSSADGIEIALREHDIKCKRKGGVSFFEAREIKALCDLLGILVNHKDLMAFIHIFEYAKGIGNAKAKEIYDILATLGNKNIIKGLLDPDKNAKIQKKRIRNFQLGLFDDDEEFQDKNKFLGLGIGNFERHKIFDYINIDSEAIKFLFNLKEFLKENLHLKKPFYILQNAIKSQIFDEISSNLARKRATRKNGTLDDNLFLEVKDRIKYKALNLAHMSKQYDDLESFYNFITLGSRELEDGIGVNLLTVHASKGLEFQKVFVVDLAEGRFPNKKLMNMGGNLEEERRLFYVAVTRAKDELYLTYAKKDNMRNISYEPSIFLKEAGFIKNEG